MKEPNRLSNDDIAFVNQLAREGGRLALEMRHGVGIRTKTGPTDFVTDADVTISRLFIEQLTKRFPDDLVVSEEENQPICAAADIDALEHPERIWLIDPIDGTEN